MAFWQVKTSMAETKNISTPSDLWPLPWDEEGKNREPAITQKEQDELQALMAAENACLEAERNSGHTTVPESSASE